MIEELITGNDGLVRAAKLRTASGRTNRAIKRLYPLQVMADPMLQRRGRVELLMGKRRRKNLM